MRDLVTVRTDSLLFLITFQVNIGAKPVNPFILLLPNFIFAAKSSLQ